MPQGRYPVPILSLELLFCYPIFVRIKFWL